jgi:hypothetical protein
LIFGKIVQYKDWSFTSLLLYPPASPEMSNSSVTVLLIDHVSSKNLKKPIWYTSSVQMICTPHKDQYAYQAVHQLNVHQCCWRSGRSCSLANEKFNYKFNCTKSNCSHNNNIFLANYSLFFGTFFEILMRF